MAFFPKIVPFFDPDKEQEIYTDSEGRLKSRLFHKRKQESSSDNTIHGHVGGGERRDFSVVRGTDNHRHMSYDQNDRNFVHEQSVFDNSDYSVSPDDQDNLFIDRYKQNGNFNKFNTSHNSSFHSNNDYYPSASPVPDNPNKRPVFSIGERQDFFQEIDDPLSAHQILQDDSFCEKNINIFNDKFRGSDHSSCSFGSENNPISRPTEKKQERNKCVYLTPRISDSKRLETSGVALCEQLFGIVLCQYNHKPGPDSVAVRRSPALRERKVIVQDVVHGSPAEFSCKIHRGDMLISVNDIQVSWMNMGSVFRALSHHMEAKLTLKSPVIIGTPPHPSKAGSNLYRRLTNTSVKQGEKTLSDNTYGVLYLTLDDVSSEPDNDMCDLVYQYPHGSSMSSVQSIRGVFLTLAHSLLDVTGFTAKSSSLLLNSEIIHVCYLVEDRNVLVLLLPANRVSLHNLGIFRIEVGRLLKFLFCDIKSAFQQINFHKLDQLFALTFRRILTPDFSSSSGVISSRFFDSQTEVRKLPISDENLVICDEILSEFESLDFDEFLTDEQLDSRRLYTSLGSILFYKNWLLTSHMSQSDQSDTFLFLKHHALFNIMANKSLDNLVIWQEVYLSARCYSSEAPLSGYMEHKGRCFLLLVGLNNYLMCTILESGGISREVVGNPTVDTFYVDQIKATLEQLDEDEVSMTTCCEERISSEDQNISLVGVEKFLPKSKTKEEGFSPQKLPASPKSSVSPVKPDSSRYKYNLHIDRLSNASDDRVSENTDSSYSNMRRQGSKLSYGSNDSTGSSSSAGLQKGGIMGKASRFTSMVELSGIGKSLSVLHLDRDLEADTNENKLTRGKSNVLFNYIQIDEIEGVIICPANQYLVANQSAITSQLLNAMYYCCSNIRKSFHQSQDLEKVGERQKCLFKTSDMMEGVQELGVLFQIPSPPSKPSSVKKPQLSPQPLTYWVIGRRILQEQLKREIFVCFHESVPQSTIEMAFSLGFGSCQ